MYCAVILCGENHVLCVNFGAKIMFCAVIMRRKSYIVRLLCGKIYVLCGNYVAILKNNAVFMRWTLNFLIMLVSR